MKLDQSALNKLTAAGHALAHVSAALVLLASPAIAASARSLQLKGLQLGVSTAEVCGTSEVRNHQTLLDAAGMPLHEFPAKSCQVSINSVGGVRPSLPASLLFWRGRLTAVSIQFEALELEDLAALRGSLSDNFGKPSQRTTPPFVTDTWRQRGHTLELERTGQLPTNVGVFLREEKAWQEYQAAKERAERAIEASVRRGRSSDVRN